MTELSATLKYAAGHDASWLVVKAETAADLKKAIEEATGLPGEGITLVDLIHNASQHVHQVGKAGAILGATVVPETAPATVEEERVLEPAKAPLPEAAPAPAGPDIAGLIADAKNQGDLGDIYLKNKSAFDANPDLMKALQARAGELA